MVNNQNYIKLLICIMATMCTFASHAQTGQQGLPCGALDPIDVGIGVVGYQPDAQTGLVYWHIPAEKLRKGFTISLKDTSYKVHSFIINYSSMNKFREYRVSGPVVTVTNAGFLKRVQEGDLLSVECVNISKGGRLYFANSVWINVIK